MNGVELYLLAQKLTMIAAKAMPADSALHRITPGERLVLEDAIEHMGTSADEIAERTGLQPGQVSAIVSKLTGDGYLEQSGQQITASRGMQSRDVAAPPIDEALAAALGTGGAGDAPEIARALESLAGRLGTEMILRTAVDFDAAYRSTPLWETGRPQPALVELAEAGAIRGQVLDVGCGTGEHALMAAGLGLPATGIDASSIAIEIAKRKAAERNLSARFAVHDALDLGALGSQFDTVIDSALFHVFTDEERLRYAESLREVIPPGGRYFMLCFRGNQPSKPKLRPGPRRVSQEEIETTFTDGWRIDEIEPATIDVTADPAGARAWRTSITRI